MKCTINDINLSFDKDNRIRKTILRVTGHDADKAYVLASFLYDAGFKQFLLENITKDDVLKGETISFDNISIDDFVKLKQNKFGSLLNLYYIEHYHSVDNSKTKKGLGRLNGFSSASAKTVAKNYNASLLITEYRKEFSKPKDKRRKPLEIIAEVNKQMLNTFYDRTNDFARFIINDNSFSQEAKEYANKYLEVLREINEVNENIANITSWGKATTQVRIEEKTRLNKLKRENASEELIKESTDKINKLGEEITFNAAKRDEYVSRGATLTRDKYVIAQNLVALYSNDVNEDLGIRLRNYANLVAQTRGDANAWYFQVFNTKTMTSIIKDFNNIGDIEEFMQEQEEDDDAILSQYDGQTIDETTKSWEDHNYKNFNQAIDSKLRIILSSIPKLAEKYNIADEVQALDTNNELGVPTFMDAQFITVQIFSFADFTSVDSMINSLDIKSKSIKNLYGLGQIVNMMKRSKSFANYMYANFAKPVVNKTMLVISDIANENGISFDYSNVNAFPLTELIFRMANKLRATYNSAYDSKDIETLKDIQTKYNKSKDKSVIVEDIFDIVSKYFPNFNKQVFNNYFDNLPTNEADESINQLIRNIAQIISSVGNLKATINNAEEENRKDYESKKAAYYKTKKEYDKAINDYNKLSNITRANTKKPEPPVFPTYPRIDYANYELSKTAYKNIIAFAKQIVNYTESKARLNSTNAEGTTGSDVIKNCFVSRFFEQIMAESATDSNAGLENLKRYITQGTDNGQVNQYSNNPLFFGVKDENGNIITPGMFTRTATGYEINPNAKEILKLMLFDGSRNNQDGLGNNYASMSKVDFFITQYMAFTKSINEATDEGFTKKIGNLDSAVYPMRIGSDAPKIFFIRAPRYNDRQVRYALYNHVIDELNMMITGINNLFVQDGDAVIDGNMVPLFKIRKDITNLIGRAFFNENKANELKKQGKTDFTSAIVEKGRLTGKLFNFYRLFDVNGYKANEAIESMLSLYGQGDKAGIMSVDKDGRMVLTQNDTIVWDGTKFVLNLSNEQKQELKNIVRTWADNFLIEAKSRTSGFIKILTDNNISYSQNELDSFLLNAANMNMNYDDLFEGDYKYYNKARDFLKRTKETQAGGDGYAGFNILEDYDNNIKELKWRGRPEVISLNSTAEFNQDGSPVEKEVIINNRPLIARNGWRGVTIYNTNKASDYADNLQKELERIFIKQGLSNEVAKDRSVAIARGYGLGSKQRTIINDAQSYITFEEFIRRKHADGTIQDYADIISQLLDDTPVENINIDDLNNRIQVQKNFYFDKVFDKDTGLFYPRQIKNAEFVLIPKLLPEGSELRKVHDWMQKNNIGQLNTAETSKAAKKNIFTIWDVETGEFNENFEEDFNNSYIENYTYQYLYKQQEVPQHMMDENNKAGIQIMKKIIDNIINESEKDNPERKKLKQYADEYLDAYTANIKDDFNTFLDRMGWEYDTKLGKIVNSEYQTTDINGDKLPNDIIKTNRETLNFNNFYARAREEAARLGMDSNFIEYLIPNEFGRPTMPNWQNAYSSKLESIAQAIYNRSITRQILPGWHAAQITDVGYSKRLKFDPETGVMEVYLPRWSNLIPKDKNAKYKTVTSYYWIDSDDETLSIDEFKAKINKLAKGQKVIFKYYDGFDNSDIDPKRQVPMDKASTVAAYIIHDEKYANELIKRSGLSYTLEEFLDKSEIEIYTDNSIEKKLITDIYALHGDDAIIAQIQKEGLDIHLGYRIPTEGKQSIAVLKVVGFTNDCLGSTIVVPAEWVTQTGSDFDVDSVYGICWEMYATKDKNGKTILKKVAYEERDVNDQDLYIRYVNNKLDARVKRTDIGEEIESSIKEVRDKINNVAERNSLNEEYNKLDDSRNELFSSLPNWAKYIIDDANKKARTIAKQDKTVTDLRSVYSEINSIFTKYLEKYKISNDVKSVVEQYMDYQTSLIDVMNRQEGLPAFDKDMYRSEKAEAIQRIVEQAKQEYFNQIQQAAKKAGIIDYNTWSKQSFVDKLSKRARNNYILDRMIKIMNDETSREEQYGRSKFENIVDGEKGANDIIDKISGETSRSRSPYNPLDQLDYFEDAMGGVRLKALSVMWDTFTSKNNKVRAFLDDIDAVEVILTMDGLSAEDSVIEYNEDSIRKSYDDDIQEYEFKPTNNVNINHSKTKGLKINPLQDADEKVTIKAIKEIGIDNIKYTIDTLNSDNNELSDSEKLFIDKKLGNKPRVLVASEATDPVFHSKKIKALVEQELAKPYNERRFHMMYLITKHDGLPFKELAELKIPKFIHFSITSLGGTKYEPGVMKMDDLLDRIESFINNKVINPALVTIRIDPIIPGVTKKEDIRHIIERATSMGIRQFKFSLMDSYGSTENTKNDRYIVKKMRELGYDWETYYDVNFNNVISFNPKEQYIQEYYAFMDDIADEFKVSMITCGEQPKNLSLKRIRTNVGCINVDAMNKAMGTTDIADVKGHQRKECSCYGNKVDACSYGETCASSCVYCYAKHNGNEVLQYYNKDGSLKDNNFTRVIKIDKVENDDINQDVINNRQSDNHKVLFKARRIGFSNTNRNIVGELVTTYTSQTTSHHLDAVKMGSVPNVDEYTFSTYKLLSTLGIDYETIIGFIRQPVITRLVANNNLINSVFLRSKNNPIKMTINDIAANLGIKNGKYKISHITSLDDTISVLKTNNNFKTAFTELFNIDISSMSNEQILNIKLPLDKQRLFTRIKRQAQNKGDVYQNAAFDLGIILTFRNIRNTAEKISNLITSTNADKFGAINQIRENRVMIDLINELRKDKTLSKNGVSFIDLIYPTIDDNNNIIDINASEYKSIAAIYSYATLCSFETNTQIFVTENEDFAISERIVQQVIHHKFTSKEYAEYKRYAISSLYNKVQKLLTPLIIDKRGNIIPDNQRITEISNKENDVNKYWDAERSRIYGYGIASDGDFKVENLNNPTEEDVVKFNNLTPAQKVLFIQRHFPDHQGIFNYIKVTLLNNTDVKYKGISRQYLSYDDQIDNIEDLLYMFINSFSNKNKPIKLTAIDLVKYAYIAEGFNYKSGYISKIIPNSVLYTRSDEGGFDIINNSDPNNSLNSMIYDLPYDIRSEEFIENFMRSHSAIAPIFRLSALPDTVIDEYGNERYAYQNKSTIFKSLIRPDGLIYLDGTSTNKFIIDLIKYLQINTYNGGFIKVNFPISKNESKTVLFAVEARNEEYNEKGEFERYQDYFLVPLNLLDKYENYDYSYNENFNTYNDREYYTDIIDAIARTAAGVRETNKQLEANKQKLIDVTSVSNKNVSSKRNPIGAYKAESVSLQENKYGLTEYYNNSDNYISGPVKKLVDGIVSHIELDINFTTPYIQYNPSIFLKNLIPAGEFVVQTVDVNGVDVDVVIAHLPNTNKFNKAIRENDEYKSVRESLKETNTSIERADVYRVIKHVPEKVYATTDLIVEPDETVVESSRPLARRGKSKPIDVLSSIITKTISYEARRNETAIAERFVKELEHSHVNKFSRSSLSNNRISVYRAAARYYRSASNAIINKLNKFVIDSNEYSMDDEAMYEALISHDEYFREVAQVILDGITFGNQIADIFKLDITAEDSQTKEAVESIINSINAVRQNSKLNEALNNVINIYFKKYSTNPEIMRDILELRETFGDLDNIDAWISNPADIDNNEVQVIIKQVYNAFAKAELFDVRRNVKEWEDELAKVEVMNDSFDINHVIDFEHFRIKPAYKNKFLEDRQRVIDELNEAMINRYNDLSSYNKYLRAKFARDKFMFDYTHQIMIDDYYKRDLAMRDEVMRKGGSLYTEFMMLRAQLYDDNFTIDETIEQTAERKARINNKIRQLLSKSDIVGNEKSFEEQAKIDAITNYINKYRDLQDEYFEDKEYDGFQEDYIRYKEYLDNYNIEHPDYSFERKMQNVQYRDAYNWIKSNGRIQFGKEESKKLTNAFKALTGRNTVLSNGIYYRLKNIPGVIDEAGNIDATKLTKEQIKQIRDDAEFELSQMYDDGTGELILIKSVPSDISIMMKKGNDNESKEIMKGIRYTNDKEKARIIGRINEIIGKTVDRKTGKIDIAVLFNDDVVSYDEREELADLYAELRGLRSEFTKNYLKKNNKVFEEHIDTSYLSAMLYYKTNLKNTKQGSQFLKIFTELDENGNMVANSYIFGYRQPKPEYIDNERTNARDYLNDNVEFITTEYYDIARREAESKGEEEFNEWFKLNHIYNPYSHKYEPLKIWTKLSAKPGSKLAESISYTPMFQNMERTVREDKFINNNYKKFSNNYRTGSTYDTGIVLSDKEKALQNLLIQTLNKYATTYQGKRFVAEGYLPRERQNEINSRWVGSQLLSLMGLDWHSGTDSDSYQKEVDYTNDREADMDMLSFLKTKGTKKYLIYPNRNDFDTEEEYRNKLNQVKEENRKIKAENEKLDNAIVNKDWKAIMKNFVHNATIFNSRQAAKPYIHLLLEDLAANNAYAIDGMWNKHLIKDSNTSTEDDTRYKTIPQTKTRQVVSTLSHRLLFNEYHKNSTPRAIANFLQNMTSAKYMIFNAYGGVANVATGKVNIFMEEAANEYFGFKEFHAAELQYLRNSVKMIQHLYSDKAPNLTIAFIKQFNIVNFDQVLQFGDGSVNLDESLKRFRNWMYSFQSIGEHYMQNSVLLAMLKSNRLYTDRNGVQRIGDFKDYTWDVEQKAMEDIISDNNDLLIQYEIYKNKIKYDLEEKLAFDTGRKDYNRNFLYMIRDNENEAVRKLYKDTASAYHKRRKELLDEAKEEFIKNDTVESLFELINGEAVLKQEKVAAFNAKGKNAIGDLEHLIGGFKKKVEEVNHKIHGVYDKISAAQLETKWYGSIVMQYHKHLYTGIFKRWRRKGFYSEFRGSRERGSYQTFIDFMGTEFTNFNKRVRNKSEEGEFTALGSIQVAMESLINTLINIQFNWQNLSNWEKANMRRNLGEMSGVLVAALVVMALYGLNDDDDIKNDPFKASMLYLADRLYSDTSMYSPLGLITEAKTAWSSPIASANGPSDLIKAMMLIPQALFDPDYNPEYQTGQYRGENKLEILLRRNIPGVRPYDRIRSITRNNKYYKIGESQIGINIAKNIGKSLRDN